MRSKIPSWRMAILLSVSCLSPLCARAPLHAGEVEYRTTPCVVTDAAALTEWQQASRAILARTLRMEDQFAANHHDRLGRSAIPLNTRVLETSEQEADTRYLVEIDSRPDRTIKVVLTIPKTARPGQTPAVVCIHGHGGHRDVVYDTNSVYHGFAHVLAGRGYVTLSTDVGQHSVQDPDHRTLMGERLWDLVRVVDLAVSREEVDRQRIGCGGLSLGGEMAMWLGAMDTRIACTVSSGFLTTMENLRHGHCMCWDFPGLQKHFDFADVYCLICPRALQCQNGKKERLPGGFPVDLAQRAMHEIKDAYRVAGAENRAELDIHPEGHVFDVPAAMRIFDANLKD